MLDWVKKFFVRQKIVDARAFLGVDWPGSFVDAFRRVPKPTKDSLIKEYKGWAYVCANYNARYVFGTKLKLFRRLQKGEKCRWNTRPLSLKETNYVCKAQRMSLGAGERLEEVSDHPALSLLRRPNPHMTGLRLLEFMQLYQEMAGEAAVHVIYSEFGGSRIPVALYLLQPQYLKAEEDPKTGFVDHYVYGFKEAVRLETDEVIRFSLPNLRSPYLAGHSPLLGVYEDVHILDLFKATEAAILSNEGRPDVLISAKDGLGDVERLEKKWLTKFRRGGNHGLLLVEDDVTVTPLQYAPKDLAFTQVGEAARQAVCLAYGIPPVLFDKTGATQYDTDNAVSNRHILNAIVPRLERNQDTLNTEYINLFDDSGRLFFAYEDPSVVNQQQKLEEDTKLITAGVVTPNEIRVTRGYEPTAWGFRPAGMYNAKAPASDEQEGNDGQPQGDDTAPDDQQEAAEGGTIQSEALNGTQIASLLQIAESVGQGLLTAEACRLLILASFPLLDTKLVDQLVKELAKIKAKPPVPEASPGKPTTVVGSTPTAPGSTEAAPPTPGKAKAHCSCKGHSNDPRAIPDGKELAGVMQKYFARQRAEVMASLKSKSKANGLPTKFLPLDKWDRELYTEAQPLIEAYYAKEYGNTAKDIVTRAGISPDVFNVTNPETAKAVKKLTLAFCAETNQTTSSELQKALDDLRESMEEGLTAGERLSNLRDRVETIFDSAEDDRAFKIAQTESSRAHHEGLRQAAKDSGVVKGFTLLPSSACCELCKEIADSVGEIGLDDSFYTDESEGTPDEYRDRFCPIHPNCECTVLQVLTKSDNGQEPEEKPEEEPEEKPEEKPELQIEGMEVEVNGNVSDKMKERFKEAAESIPVEVRKALKVDAMLCRKVTEAMPELDQVRPRGWNSGNWQLANGCYRPSTGQAVLAEVREMDNGVEIGTGPEGAKKVFRHEYGHGADSAMGNYSQSPAFGESYGKDLEALLTATNSNIESNGDFHLQREAAELQYLIQPKNPAAGKEEAFAEVFAAIHGGGCLDKALIEKHFPESCKRLESTVKSWVRTHSKSSVATSATKSKSGIEMLRLEGPGGIIGDAIKGE